MILLLVQLKILYFLEITIFIFIFLKLLIHQRTLVENAFRYPNLSHVTKTFFLMLLVACHSKRTDESGRTPDFIINFLLEMVLGKLFK